MQFLGENVILGEKTAVSEGKWPTSGRKLVFLVGNAEFFVRKLVFLAEDVIFLGRNLVFLGENDMLLVETWYLWEETAVPGGKWHVFGRKLVFVVENVVFL